MAASSPTAYRGISSLEIRIIFLGMPALDPLKINAGYTNLTNHFTLWSCWGSEKRFFSGSDFYVRIGMDPF
jgi:hypothetical protein